jgi:hypothetical protein
MFGEEEWRIVENASAENRQLGGVVRRLEGVYGGNPPFDWQEPWWRRLDVLGQQLGIEHEANGLIRKFEGADYEVGGDEHLVIRVESQPDRVYKMTHGECFGCRPYFSRFDPDGAGKHFHGSINEDPVFYLKRWMLLNHLGEYQTRFEGWLPPDGNLRVPRICISQPMIESPNPSRSEMRQALEAFGFRCISLDAYLNFETRILLTDAAPRNVRIVNGAIALFDAIACIASDETAAWAEETSGFKEL